MKKLSIIAIFASFALAKSMSVMPYAGYLNYGGDTKKDNGNVFGVYLSYYDKLPKYNSGYKIELNLERDLINYTGDIKDYDSHVVGLIGNWYYGFNYVFKIGINHLNVDNSGVKEHGNVYIVGANYYEYLKYNVGIDYYKTLYKSERTINVNQISPYVGYNFGNYNSSVGSFYVEAKLNYIFSNKELATKKHYTNMDLSLSNYRGKYTTTLKMSLGKTAYKVANGGFVLYNTGDEYKNQYGLDVSYAYSKTTSLQISYNKSYFNNIGDAHSDTIMLSLTKVF